MAALASSQSAYASSRASFFDTLLKSLRPVDPSSPVRVYMRVRCTAMVKPYRRPMVEWTDVEFGAVGAALN
jgi:hypothetical protein